MVDYEVSCLPPHYWSYPWGFHQFLTAHLVSLLQWSNLDCSSLVPWSLLLLCYFVNSPCLLQKFSCFAVMESIVRTDVQWNCWTVAKDSQITLLVAILASFSAVLRSLDYAWLTGKVLAIWYQLFIVWGGLDVLLVWFMASFVSAVSVSNQVLQRLDLMFNCL